MQVAQLLSDEPRLIPSGSGRVTPGLRDVSETMLWALHNRAIEAKRADGILTDPDSVRIYHAIDYDFVRNFGDPAGSLAARGAAIDQVLRGWLVQHPDGLVVSLGEGLETQVHRVDNGTMRWLSVDLPDAIRLREHFLPPTERFRHIAAGALDPAWMDSVDPSRGVFIIAQGLLMYLQPDAVSQLFSMIADRFPAAQIVFDVIPRWFSCLTMIGLNQTSHYRLPKMPWGIDRDEIRPTLLRWHPRLAHVEFLDYRIPRGPLRLWDPLVRLFPAVRNELPSLIHVTIGTTTRLSLIRNQSMTLNQANGHGGETLSNVFALATRTAGSGNDLAIAAGQVIAKRVALGVAAAVNPMTADHAEFARMVPEKMEAFSAAGMAMFQQSEEVRSHITRLASNEVITTAQATYEMATCSNPVSMLEAQGRFARAWWDRTTSNVMALTMMTLSAHAAVLGPLKLAVAANTERLA